MSLLAEFKKFAMRGNVVDLAVGVVIGAAFGKIVSSLVDGVIMPLLGLVVGAIDLGDRAITLKAAVVDAAGTVVEPAVLLKYGAFLQTIFDFILIAFAIFALVKLINRLHQRDAEKPAPEAPSAEVRLLTEIRDELRARPAATDTPRIG